jgi:adenosylcobinamide-GDP ribazoletransferase
MSLGAGLRNGWSGFLVAVQFLTRIPVPAQAYAQWNAGDALAGAAGYFPVVGLLIGGAAAGLNRLLLPHLPRTVAAIAVVGFLVGVTGCLHEDGLADAADGFGGGRSREQTLAIMRDSRIGSYGATALILSLSARWLLIASLPSAYAAQYLVAAHVLCRWTALPLGRWLDPARSGRGDHPGEKGAGQGARLARLTGFGALLGGSLAAIGIVAAVLRRRCAAPALSAVGVTLLTGMYYRRRIGGITGDCFGATSQIAEIAVYLCGVCTL